MGCQIFQHGTAKANAFFISCKMTKTPERFVWATALLTINPTDKILEIGCGAGLWANCQVANIGLMLFDMNFVGTTGHISNLLIKDIKELVAFVSLSCDSVS